MAIVKSCSNCHINPARPSGGYCKPCHADYMRASRPKHRDLPQKERKKAIARAYANVYQRRGKLIPKPCYIPGCGSFKDIQKHHPDYSKPLDVKWMCRKHHNDLHAGRIVAPEMKFMVRKWLTKLS